MPDTFRPTIERFTLHQYRAFQDADVTLGRLTVILGRNNAGKSALCFSPLHFSQAFRDGAEAPLVAASSDFGFGSPQSAIFRRQPSGTQVQMWLKDAGSLESVTLGVTVIPERNYTQQVTSFKTVDSAEAAVDFGLVEWEAVRDAIAKRPALSALAREVGGLRGVRPLPPREMDYLGYEPTDVGFHGERAAMMLLSSGDEGLKAVNRWFQRMRVQLEFKRGTDTFEVLARGTAGEWVNLVNSGAGIAQVLPLFVQLELAPEIPRLWCIEQPELHLHPAAHAVVAEAILERIVRDPSLRMMIETHSDAIVLRIRRELAAGRLRPEDVCVYFVDETQDAHSVVQRIELNEEGTPLWWPRGVFAEPQEEYFAIRRALAARTPSQ